MGPDNSAMNLKALRVFRLTVLHGSLSAAARHAHLSQPAASRLLAALEAELRLNLFTRTHHRLVLTDEGLSFHRQAEHILDAVDEIPGIAREIRRQSVDTLRIVTSAPVGASLLPDALQRLRRTAPTLACRIDIASRFEAERQVGSRRYDLGLLSLPVAHSIVELAVVPLVAARTQVLLPRDHRLAGQAQIALEALVDEPFVTLRPGQIWRARLEDLLAGIGARPRIGLEVGSTQLVPGFVAAGFGLGLLDHGCAAAASHTDTVMRPLAPAAELVYACVLPPAGQRPIADAFIEALAASLSARCGPSARPADLRLLIDAVGR